VKRSLLLLGVVCVALIAVVLPATLSYGHPERPTTFPDPGFGQVPAFRTHGPSLVVCKRRESARRLHREFRGSALRSRLALLRRCRFADIQAAVNHAKSNTRILIMPGVYQELPSRRVPFTPKKCSDQGKYFAETEGYGNNAPPPAGARSNDPPVRPNFRFQHDCPNARNLISIVGNRKVLGDGAHSPRCDVRCNLQLVGMGRKPGDVDIKGDRTKMDVIRVDRADGFAVRNIAVEYGAFNGIDLVELNGFHIDHVIARWNQNYGVLSFTTDHGLYENITAFGNGDSGVYPGSDPKGCSPADGYSKRRYGIELRGINSYGNTLGYSGTAGNSTYIHDSQFHDNATGLSTDSFAAGHPGMPQECFKWERNRIYSNNFPLFAEPHQRYCADTPFKKRKPHLVCPQFQVPEGSGIIIYGGNRDEIRNNQIYDNWKSGVRIFWIPAAFRGDNNPNDQRDTSNGNRIVSNRFGRSSSNARLPNGYDITWDGEGAGNCVHGNSSADAGGATQEHQPAMPDCGDPTVGVFRPGSPPVLEKEAACAAWDPKNMTNPPGCDWFTLPPKPR